MKDERLEKLADVLVNYSTKVKKGDRVAISAEDAALPFIQARWWNIILTFPMWMRSF